MAKNLVTVRDYLRLIFRRKWHLIVPTLGGIALIPFLWWHTADQYRAVATVRRKDMAILRSTPSSLISKSDSHISVSALRAEVLTWTNLQRVIQQTNLDKELETLADWQQMYSSLRGAISIDTIARGRGRDLIEIAVVHKDSEKAAKIANAVADNYVEQSQGASRSSSQTAVEFLSDGTEEYKQKLRESEQKLADYKQSHFSNLPGVRDTLLQKMLSLRTEKTSEELQLTRAQKRLEIVKNQIEEVPRIVEGEVTTQENPSLTEVRAQLRARERLLTSIQLDYTEEHPKVKQVKREIKELEQQVEEMPEQVETEKKQVINPEYQDLQMKKRELLQDIDAHQAALRQIEARIAANQQELENITSEEQRYEELVRDKNSAQQLYEQYHRSLATAKTRLDVESKGYETEVEIIARAMEPQFPYRNLEAKLALASLAGGMAVGIALMFGMEYTDRSFRNVEDAAHYLGVPVLGSIPTIHTPQEAAVRRARRIKVLLAFVLLALVIAGGVFFLYQYYPEVMDSHLANLRDQMNRFYLRVKEIINGFVG